MIELKALMGDSSDNIPGVAGVGEKTATDLISRYHSIDYIYDNIESLEIKDGIRTKLISGKENAFLSRELGTICKTAPINNCLDDYKYKPQNTYELSVLMTKLELFKTMEKMGLHAESAKPQTEVAATKITVCTTAEAGTAATILKHNDEWVVVSDNKCFKCDEATAESILADNSIKKRVYDYKNLYKTFKNTQNVSFDALLAGYLCNPSASSYSVDRLCQEYGAVMPEFAGDADEALKNAALFDNLCDILEKELEKSGQSDLLLNIEIANHGRQYCACIAGSKKKVHGL
jgi:DNA polymerase-1